MTMNNIQFIRNSCFKKSKKTYIEKWEVDGVESLFLLFLNGEESSHSEIKFSIVYLNFESFLISS